MIHVSIKQNTVLLTKTFVNSLQILTVHAWENKLRTLFVGIVYSPRMFHTKDPFTLRVGVNAASMLMYQINLGLEPILE